MSKYESLQDGYECSDRLQHKKDVTAAQNRLRMAEMAIRELLIEHNYWQNEVARLTKNDREFITFGIVPPLNITNATTEYGENSV